jgi:DNA-binding GntR family transcriptional regulator
MAKPKSNTLLRRTITDTLIDELREEIRSGRIKPGSRLRQLEVAERFGVSSTPVREAFASLEREGLLVSSPHRGVVVFHPTVEDLQETYDIRIPLEAVATEKAVENMTDKDLDALDDLLAQMGASTTQPNQYNRLNQTFHGRIYRASKRPKLEKLIADLREASAAYLRLYATLAPTADQTQEEHARIVEACRERNPRAAAEAVESHLRHTVERVSTGLPDIAGEEREPGDSA